MQEAGELKVGDSVLMNKGTIPGVIGSIDGHGNITATWTRVTTFVFKPGELVIAEDHPDAR